MRISKRGIIAGLAIITAVGAAGGALAATSGTGSSATAVTILHARPDSGFGGNTWANDALTRTAAITLTGQDPILTDCGPGATTCYFWTGTISDTGTAYAITGATSPGADGIPVQGTPKAAVIGGATVNFFSTSSIADAGWVPSAVTGGNGVSTGNWVEQFFTPGTAFGAGPSLTEWSWQYTDAADCQQWTDALNITQADSGDITGVYSCPVVSGGHVVSVSASRATIAWNQTVTSSAALVIHGPGKINGHVSTVHVTQAVYGGLSAGHTYTVTIQPLWHGAPAGAPGRITFRTAAQ